MTYITASMLYNLTQCPHRVARDLFADPAERNAISAFTQLLWDRGHLYEKEVVGSLGEFLDLSGEEPEEREERTLAAMKDGVPLIYQGRIRFDDLLGEPDLLRKVDNGYVPIDIKSGAGEESVGDDAKKPKKHYAVQLALYVDVLERLGFGAGHVASVIDIHGEEVLYDLDAKPGPKSNPLWQTYQETLNDARGIVARQEQTRPALASICKQCHWRVACREQIVREDDLTLIPELGRAKRDAFMEHVDRVDSFANMDPNVLKSAKGTVVKGVGLSTLEKYHARAVLLKTEGAKPYLTGRFDFPTVETEIFFDVEVDPFRPVCYLHGFLERRGQENGSEEFVPCLADEPTPAAERAAFAKAVKYLQSRPNAVIYYYSPYERTTWRQLREKYPDVIDQDELEALFDEPRSVDLYTAVVRRLSEWPTNDHSIKTLATYLGFEWRDEDPSGAASIEWYHQWVNSGEDGWRARILDYNEDDCRATRVLLDGLRGLPVQHQ